MNTRYVLFLSLLTASEIVLPLRAQVVNDGATRTLSNVTNDITGDVTVGTNGAFTLLTLSDNALLTNSANGVISLNPSATSNEVRLVSASARWLMGGTLRVGSNGSFSTLVVSNGAFVRANSGSLGTRVGSGSNVVLVTGSGSLWSNVGSLPGTDLLVGGGGSGNQLIVSNGGRVMGNSGGIVGNNAGASNNLARVTGSGSVWSNAFNVRVGFNGTGNRLVASNGGTVLAGNVFIGFNSLSANNRVTVDGGTLRVASAAGTGVLDVRRGTNVLNAGMIDVDRLLVANSAGRFEFNGGTLSVGQSTVANGLSFDVGDGASPATLNLRGNGIHSFSSDLIVRSNATVMGNGTFLAPIIRAQAGSRISPGTAPGDIGRLSSSGLVELRGFSNMEISKSGGVLTNDQFQAADITYLGLVIAIKIGPDALTAGDRFQLFPAEGYGGSGAIFLPGLAPGLRWVNNLRADGSIEVESLAPSVTTLPASGLSQTNATLNGLANPKGTDTTAWFEFGFSTNYGNVTPPQSLGSGTSDTNFSEAIAGLIPIVSYHFRAVASNSFGVVFGADQSFPRVAQHDYVKASNTGASDTFGEAVAMSGDTLVVGATGEAAEISVSQGVTNIANGGTSQGYLVAGIASHFLV